MMHVSQFYTLFIFIVGVRLRSNMDPAPPPPPPSRPLQDGAVAHMRDLLAAGANLEERHPLHNATALHAAASSGNTAACRLLVDAGCNLNAVNKDGDTALHGAAYWGHLGACKLLVESGADGYISNKRDERAADWANRAGKEECVSYLRKFQGGGTGEPGGGKGAAT